MAGGATPCRCDRSSPTPRTEAASRAPRSYSHVVAIDGFYYLSGQTPLDPRSSALVVGTIADQTRQCVANLIAVLAAAGLTLDHVIKCNTYLTDMNDFAEYDAAYRSFYSEPFPARTMVQVAGLPMGAQIEIEMVTHD